MRTSLAKNDFAGNVLGEKWHLHRQAALRTEKLPLCVTDKARNGTPDSLVPREVVRPIGVKL